VQHGLQVRAPRRLREAERAKTALAIERERVVPTPALADAARANDDMPVDAASLAEAL